MESKLIKYEYNRIFDFLLSQNTPIYEINILRYITGKKYLSARGESLYRFHFSLYHCLYLMKRAAGFNSFYLHLDPMRIRLIKQPGKGFCSHYDPETGKFCNSKVVVSADMLKNIGKPANYCKYHFLLYKDYYKKLLFDPLDDFYCNPDNIIFGSSNILKKIQSGIIFYSLKKGEVENALKIFGLINPNKKIIVRKYRDLAKIYHPDILNGDDSMMKELNRSYQVLREVFVV